MRQTFKTPNRRVKWAVELSAPNGFFSGPVELSEPTIFKKENSEFQKFEGWPNIIFTVYETHPAGAEISGFDCNFSIVFAMKIMHLEQSNYIKKSACGGLPKTTRRVKWAAVSKNPIVELSEPSS